MDVNNSQNQSYWFVLREDQNNVVLKGNNFTIQNPVSGSFWDPHGVTNTEAKYIETADRQYIQIAQPVKIITGVVEEIPKITTPSPDFWGYGNIKLLLSFTSGNETGDLSKEKEVWHRPAEALNTTPAECAKRYRIIKNTFIRLTKKKRLGKDIKWVYYKICEQAFQNCKTLTSYIYETWEDNKIRKMLQLYIDNINRFENSACPQKDIWKEIAEEIGTTEHSCYHKFRVLKRTYRRCLERSRDSGKHVKWPYYSYYERICYNPRPGPWIPDKIKLLIEAYTHMAHKFKSPKFHKKELWKHISEIVGESPSNCDRKFRNLKQTYLKLKARAQTGRCTTKWSYYKDFELIESICPQDQPMPDKAQIQEQNYIHELLQFYIDNKDQFNNSLKKKRHLWREIGTKLGLCHYECDRKFRNLKQTYERLAQNKQLTGKTSNWPYYSYFEKIYSPKKDCCNHKVGIDKAMAAEIRRVVQDVQESREKDVKFERLIQVSEESNRIQRERNRILQALLDRT